MTEYRKKIPRIKEETKGFWEGCKRHELLIQRCKGCGRYRFPPRYMCSECNSTDTEWSKISGRGKIYSFIVPHRPALDSTPAKGFEDEYPYAVVLVELPDAGEVRIASNMVDCEVKDIKIDMPVKVVFEDITEEITLPKFKQSL